MGSNHLGWFWNPVNNGIFTISTGDRRISEPSAVVSKKSWTFKQYGTVDERIPAFAIWIGVPKWDRIFNDRVITSL